MPSAVRGRLGRAVPALVAVLAVCTGGTAATGAYVVVTAPSGVERPAGAGQRPGAVGGPTESPPPTGSAQDSSREQAARLGQVVPPTLLVVAPQTLSRQQLLRVSGRDDVRKVTTFAAGQVGLAGQRVNMFGVNPSTFRSWVPPRTASSDALWNSLARGELAVSFETKKALKLKLGRFYPVSGQLTRRLRLGGVADFGLPGVDAMVSSQVADALGLVPALGMLINAPGADLGKLERFLHKVLGQKAQVRRLRDKPGSSSPPANPSDQAPESDGRPRTYKQLYMQAAGQCPGLSWTVLAAIGQIESGHGRNLGPSSAGALGPMQFMPATWRRYGVDGDGDGQASIMNPFDAVPAAARYLCAHGAGDEPGSLRQAVYAYNHAWWYVRSVLGLAERYAAA